MVRIHKLAARDPAFGTADYDELEVWSYIVRHFEDERHPLEFPSSLKLTVVRAMYFTGGQWSNSIRPQAS
jgi:hypothetical protein